MFAAILHNVFGVFVYSGCPDYYGCLDCDRLKVELWPMFLFHFFFSSKPLKSLSETVHMKKSRVCLCECVFAQHTEM